MAAGCNETTQQQARPKISGYIKYRYFFPCINSMQSNQSLPGLALHFTRNIFRADTSKHTFRKQKRLQSYLSTMKNNNWLIAVAAGATAALTAALVYKLVANDTQHNAEPLQPFNLDEFLGKWYEIARLPIRVEKNLADLTEEYTRDNDGSIKVITRARNIKTNNWTEVTGTLKSAGSDGVGLLKVSYLRPVYFAYVVLDVAGDYEYALVSGSSINTLWILSRSTFIPDDVKARFLYKAASIGFAIDRLEWQYGALATVI